jgi:hypothetical protein
MKITGEDIDTLNLAIAQGVQHGSKVSNRIGSAIVQSQALRTNSRLLKNIAGIFLRTARGDKNWQIAVL